MAEIKIIPLGIRDMYSYLCRKYILTYTADVYYCDEPYSKRIGYVYRERSGRIEYRIDKEYDHLSDKIEVKLNEILGPNKFWPSTVRYPVLVTRSTQTDFLAVDAQVASEAQTSLSQSTP